MIRFLVFAKAVAIAILLGIAAPPMLLAQNPTVTGTVTDPELKPIPGVLVFVQGDPTNGTVTTADGAYQVAAGPTDTLVFSALGYANQPVSVDGRDTVDVSLEPRPIDLSEIVAVGYADQSRATISGRAGPDPAPMECDGAALRAPPTLEPREPARRMSPPDPPSTPIPNACAVAAVPSEGTPP